GGGLSPTAEVILQIPLGAGAAARLWRIFRLQRGVPVAKGCRMSRPAWQRGVATRLPPRHKSSSACRLACNGHPPGFGTGPLPDRCRSANPEPGNADNRCDLGYAPNRFPVRATLPVCFANGL